VISLKFTNSVQAAAALLAMCAIGNVAMAGSTVYTCNTAKGKVFQDHPCDVAAQTEAEKTYDIPKTCGSACPPPSRQAQNSEQGQFVQAGSSAPQYVDVPVRQSQTPEGYECSDGTKTWVSKTPCPPSRTTLRPAYVNGVDQHGNLVHGFGSEAVNNPVQQTALSHEDFCKRLEDHAPMNDKGKRGESDSVYERNKQRQLNGC